MQNALYLCDSDTIHHESGSFQVTTCVPYTLLRQRAPADNDADNDDDYVEDGADNEDEDADEVTKGTVTPKSQVRLKSAGALLKPPGGEVLDGKCKHHAKGCPFSAPDGKVSTCFGLV